MTRHDLRILCTALGFSAVIMNDVPQGKQVLRATTIARLIESFCQSEMPEAFELEDGCDDVWCGSASLDQAIGRYKTELRTEGSAELPQDRGTLVKFYDRLLLRREHYEQREFYTTGSTEMIANRVLHMVEEEIRCDETKAKS